MDDIVNVFSSCQSELMGVEEFGQIAKQYGAIDDPDIIQEIFNLIDDDKDGKINQDQWLNLFLSNNPEDENLEGENPDAQQEEGEPNPDAQQEEEGEPNPERDSQGQEEVQPQEEEQGQEEENAAGSEPNLSAHKEP